MRFSEKQGLVPVRSAIQGRSLDDTTRTRLWNAILYYLPKERSFKTADSWRHNLYRRIWGDFLKLPVDSMGGEERVRSHLRSLVTSGQWYEVYDLFEFIIEARIPDSRGVRPLTTLMSRALSEEMAGFRWFEGQGFIEITDENEIAAIEDAIAATTHHNFKAVHEHLSAALAKLSDRHNPDYRNSIKESISAVEATVQVLTKKPNAQLADALRLLKTKAPVHGAFESALKKLYAYTSDAQGIRHALTDEPTLDSADGKFMLVACSAFVVYLIQKCL